MDGWPPVKVKRIRGECPNEYEKRAEQIRKIIDGFRHGMFTGRLADEMDAMLERLQRSSSRSSQVARH